jgi:hypothetical protein
MKYLNLILISFIISAGLANAQAIREKSTILQSDEAKRVAKQCSRYSPSDYTDTWMPSLDDIRKMERNLSEISKLRAKCCIEGAGIEDPDKWYLQYAGLIWKGKKIIYISAIGRDQPTDLVIDESTKKYKEVPSNTWKDFATIICDGGNAWGVIYDPQTNKFSNLSVNGVG